ncbi:MAG: AAA-like domain-containing protein [Woeseiaceae bacterium]|nr:AAA-like domain-containing protein [Woeseiaceae bacterium]
MAEDSGNKQVQDERAQTDATGEFFSVGAPLHAVRAGYVRRDADDHLYETVVGGRYAHVLAPERSGKSSLVAATAARLEAHGHKVAILDLQQIGVRDGGGDPGRWYYNVAYRLLRQLRIRYDLQSWWHDKSVLSNRQRLVEFYSEIVLQFVPERIAVFVDEIQCIEDLPFAEQLLASFRAAHNARTTDPDFSRLTFILLGECDPVSLVAEPELSPFNVTQQVQLEDFSRKQIDLFATELNLAAGDAKVALDRIFHWTRGQPYLTQKLARWVSRDHSDGDLADRIDKLATTQLAGRAALHSEPHMSHIHRVVVNDAERKEAMLNLYGRVRKGIEVSADLGSAAQRRLMAVGLIEIDHDGNLRVRNRLYELVFTARWANENLPLRMRVPALAAGLLVLFALVPFWYTQWFPGIYTSVLTSSTVELDEARMAYENFRSFPGHADTADRFFRSFVEQRALAASTPDEVDAVAALANALPEPGRMPETLRAAYWDRQAFAALREQRRDDALIATLQSLDMSTPRRRQRAASLISDDYPLLLATLPPQPGEAAVFDPGSQLLTSKEGARISQWSYAAQDLQRRDDWSITALEIVPLVRRVIVGREGTVDRIGLTLNLSHARLADLRIKIIAPSGRAVEVDPGLERAASGDDIRIPSGQLRDLVGEPLNGTWSISVRDERLGVAGQFVGWNLKLNSQGAVEAFQRGLNVPDPVEKETENTWFDPGGRYAVARAMQSDSARIWDLAFAEPVRAIAVNENEVLIGVDAGARRLITSTQDSVNVWDTATGGRIASLPVGAASMTTSLTDGGSHLFVTQRGDIETRIELWSLEQESVVSELAVAGVPSLIAIDPTGSRVAVADYDRAVRVWDLQSGELLAQIDLAMQPSEIHLAAGGETLGAVHGQSGVSLWSLARPSSPLLEELAAGDWRLVFSPSGASVLAGRAASGFQIYASRDGRIAGPPLAVGNAAESNTILAFSEDEQIVVTGNPEHGSRFWRVTELPPVAEADGQGAEHPLWQPSADHMAIALPGGQRIAIGDPDGNLHMLPAGAGLAEVQAMSEDVSFLGHNAEIVVLGANRNGGLLGSAAVDNTVRVWNTSTGQPLPWFAEVGNEPIKDLAFSPDSTILAVLQPARVTLLDVAVGTRVAELDLGGVHNDLAFAGVDRLYLAGESGALRLLARDTDGNWSMQQPLQGSTPIRHIAAAPRGQRLMMIDADGLASLLLLGDGRIGDETLTFPPDVQEIVFNRSGSRAYVRTSRWTHRLSLSANGLGWVDAVFSPKPLNGAGVVFGPDGSDTANRAYLPAARGGFIELVELPFPGASTAALFGNKDELLAEWKMRLGRNFESSSAD